MASTTNESPAAVIAALVAPAPAPAPEPTPTPTRVDSTGILSHSWHNCTKHSDAAHQALTALCSSLLARVRACSASDDATHSAGTSAVVAATQLLDASIPHPACVIHSVFQVQQSTHAITRWLHRHNSRSTCGHTRLLVQPLHCCTGPTHCKPSPLPVTHS